MYKAFDDKLEILNDLLFGKAKSDGRYMEDGVAHLLTMFGFTVSQHGRSQKLSDGPDLIAITPSGNTAIIECTTGLPNEGDQVAKILKRAEVIRRALQAADWPGVQLLPVVVTNLSNAEISSVRKDVEQKGIAVLAAEGIREAISQLPYPPKPDDIFNKAVERVRLSQSGFAING
jgi:hypothetical protein